MAEIKEVPELCPDDVVELAEAVRAEHHDELEDATIAYVFIPRAPKHGQKLTLGQANKESAVHKLLSKVDFIIRLSKDCWQNLTPEQQVALVDHELCHCAPTFDKDGLPVGWRIRRHDLEEFQEIVKRRGLWQSEIVKFAETVVQQQLLPFEEPE